MPGQKIKKCAIDSNEPITPSHIIIFLTKAWFVYLRIFIRRKIHRVVQTSLLGHENEIQEYQRTRLFIPVIPVTMVCIDFPCDINA